jgi:hypothetical protein
MCTMTIVAHEGGTRVVFNRDEQRTRPDAIPPRLKRSEGRLICYPVDPRGGGTWIGVSDTGVVAALLNRSGTQRSCPGPSQSRGTVVPAVLRARSIAEAVSIVRAWLPMRLAPFRIVICHRTEVYWADGGGDAIGQIHYVPLDRPVLFTSSSLGDATVFEPRKRLFEQLLTLMAGRPLEAQRLFHQHQWPGHPEMSVVMNRRDARTVSRTQIEVGAHADRIRVHYEPLPDRSRQGRLCLAG